MQIREDLIASSGHGRWGLASRWWNWKTSKLPQISGGPKEVAIAISWIQTEGHPNNNPLNEMKTDKFFLCSVTSCFLLCGYIYVLVYVHLCVSACAGWRTTLDVIPGLCPPLIYLFTIYLLLLLLFWDRVSFWPGTYLTGWPASPRDLPVSAFLALGLQACITSPGSFLMSVLMIEFGSVSL